MTGRPRGVAETLTFNRTGADTAARPIPTEMEILLERLLSDWSAGTDTNTAAPDRDYGNGDLAAAPAVASGSQRLDYDSVFFLWQTGPWCGPVPGIR